MKKIFQKVFQNQILELLTSPSYLAFVVSVFFSQVAFNMLTVVLIFLIFYLTSSNFAVAILLFTILIPQITLSFLGGVVADQGNKKMILIFGNFLRALALIALFFNWHSRFLVYIVAFLISSITQFYVPAEAPLIPTLVARDKLVAANSIFGISLFGSILIGYVLAGPFVGALGRSNVFLFLASVFLLAGACAVFISQKKTAIVSAQIKKSIGEEFKNSLSLLAKTRRVADAFFLLIFSQVIIFILATLIPGYAKSVLQIPAEDISIILFAPAAVGMVATGLLMGSLSSRIRSLKLTSIGIYISGLVLLLLPFTSRILSRGIITNAFDFVLILAVAAGVANALTFIPSQAAIQEIIPEDFRSKIYGLLFALIGLFSLLPIMIAGGVADIVGVGAVLASLGVLIIILGIIRDRFLFIVPKVLKR